MRDDRRTLPGRSNPQSVARRETTPGALRSGRRGEGAEQGNAGATPAGPVALSRIAAGARGRRHRQSWRDDDADRADAALVGKTRRRRDSGQGRRPLADRVVQGARPGDGGVDGEGARHHAHGDADQRQCRRGARGLCDESRHQGDDLLSRGYAGGECQRDRAARRSGLSRQRLDRRLRQDRRRRQSQSSAGSIPRP